MIPTSYLVTWCEPDGSKRQHRYPRRADARGSMIMLRARGCTDVVYSPVWER